MEWRPQTMTGKGTGIFPADANDPDYATHKTFTTFAAAKSYLNGLANISSGTST